MRRKRSPTSRVTGLWLAACAMLVSVRPVSAEWTFGGFTGACETRDTSLEIAQPGDGTNLTLEPVHYTSDSLESPIYYGYRVGYVPGRRWFGVEGEFVHMKVTADTSRLARADGVFRGRSIAGDVPVGSVLERFSITHGVNLLLANAVLRHQGAAGTGSGPRWMLVGRVGAGASVPHVESQTPDGASLEQYEWGSLSLQAAGGAELRITRALYLSGEYKLTRTTQDVTIVGGSARTPLLTHHLAIGVSVHVGR